MKLPQNFLDLVCRHFHLGSMSATPIVVEGGSSNLIWKCKTKTGEYAVKQMVAHSDEPDFERNVEASFQIEISAIKAGVAAPIPVPVPNTNKALAKINTTTQEKNSATYVRVHHWTDASVISEELITDKELFQLGKLIAQVHLLPLPAEVEDLTRPSNYMIPDWKSWTTSSTTSNAIWFDELESALPKLSALDNFIRGTKSLAGRKIVLSHKDTDAKNVLRDKNNGLLLIDWDAAGTAVGAYDIGTIALDWSGLGHGVISEQRMNAVLEGYRNVGMELDVYGEELFCEWAEGNLGWLRYNLERSSFEDPAQQKIGQKETLLTLEKVLVASDWIFDRGKFFGA